MTDCFGEHALGSSNVSVRLRVKLAEHKRAGQPWNRAWNDCRDILESIHEPAGYAGIDGESFTSFTKRHMKAAYLHHG